MTFTAMASIRIAPDGTIEHSTSSMPTVAMSPGLRVSMPANFDQQEASRLLRLVADHLEGKA